MTRPPNGDGPVDVHALIRAAHEPLRRQRTKIEKALEGLDPKEAAEWHEAVMDRELDSGQVARALSKRTGASISASNVRDLRTGKVVGGIDRQI